MPKKNKKTTKKIKKEVEKEIKKNFSDTPLLTPIENSEKDIKDLKVQKELNLKGNKKGNRLANIILIILVLLIILVSIDVVCVSKYDKGPYFAIKTHEYKDGGTKEQYGLGYKVIKYKQLQVAYSGEQDIYITSYIKSLDSHLWEIEKSYMEIYKQAGDYALRNETGDDGENLIGLLDKMKEIVVEYITEKKRVANLTVDEVLLEINEQED